MKKVLAGILIGSIISGSAFAAQERDFRWHIDRAQRQLKRAEVTEKGGLAAWQKADDALTKAERHVKMAHRDLNGKFNCFATPKEDC